MSEENHYGLKLVAIGDVEYLHKASLIKGFPDGEFKYTKTLSRAEALQILENPTISQKLKLAGDYWISQS